MVVGTVGRVREHDVSRLQPEFPIPSPAPSSGVIAGVVTGVLFGVVFLDEKTEDAMEETVSMEFIVDERFGVGSVLRVVTSHIDLDF